MNRIALVFCLLLLAAAATAQTGPSIGGPGAVPSGLVLGFRLTANPGFGYTEEVYDEAASGPGVIVTRMVDRDVATGMGVGLLIGWSVRPWWLVYGSIDFAGHESEDWAQFTTNYYELGTRLSLPAGAVYPYAVVAYTNHGVTADPYEDTPTTIYVGGERIHNVSAITFGAGLQIGVLDIGLLRTSGSFPEPEPGYYGEFRGPLRSARLVIGCNVWFDLGG
jgi:hypothetical protein